MARQRVECKMLAAGSKLYRHGLWFLTSHQSNQHCICCFVSCRQVVSVCRQKPNGFSHHTHCVNIGGGGGGSGLLHASAKQLTTVFRFGCKICDLTRWIFRYVAWERLLLTSRLCKQYSMHLLVLHDESGL